MSETTSTPTPAPSAFSKIGTGQMIHVGIEIVVISGIAYYFYKQNSAQKLEIETLQKRVASLEKDLVSLANQVDKLQDIMERGTFDD